MSTTIVTKKTARGKRMTTPYLKMKEKAERRRDIRKRVVVVERIIRWGIPIAPEGHVIIKWGIV